MSTLLADISKGFPDSSIGKLDKTKLLYMVEIVLFYITPESKRSRILKSSPNSVQFAKSFHAELAYIEKFETKAKKT